MIYRFHPTAYTIYFIEQHTLLHIVRGHGCIQVDFKNHCDWENKIIFLEKGQYIKFLSDSFVVHRVDFSLDDLRDQKSVRVLFKHLRSLGYVCFEPGLLPPEVPEDEASAPPPNDLLSRSTALWYRQNPFKANKGEYRVIFDVKDVIDRQYRGRHPTSALVSQVDGQGYDARALVRRKIGVTAGQLLRDKRLTESKKHLVFGQKTVKEVGYEMGYKDPAYFSRSFKKNTGKTPDQFRIEFEYEPVDAFVEHLVDLLREHHTREHTLEYYADRMKMTVQTFSRTVRRKMNASPARLIRAERLRTAKMLLADDWPVCDVAFELGFEEPNHFSSFFKRYAGMTPTTYKTKKYR